MDTVIGYGDDRSNDRVTVLAAPTRLEGLSAEFSFAIRQSSASDLRDIGLDAGTDLTGALARRARNVVTTARTVTKAAGRELAVANRARKGDRLSDHAKERRKAASDELVRQYQSGKAIGKTFFETLRRKACSWIATSVH